MGKQTKIEWTNATWNPWYGCHKVSLGCDHCYAERDMTHYGRDFQIVQRASDKTFYAPLSWKEPLLILTCSWSDFFIPQASPWREEAWRVMKQTPQHTYQLLTKRPGYAVSWYREHGWLPNVWLGVTVENQRYAPRLDVLARVPAKVRFVSCEPLLSPLNLLKWLQPRGGMPSDRAGKDVSGPGRPGMVLRGPGGANLEACPICGESPRESFATGTHSAGESRAELVEIPESNVLDDTRAKGNLRSQNRLDGLEPSGYSQGDGGQSQGRTETQQSSQQLGNADPQQEHPPQLSGLGAEGQGTTWLQEHIRQAHRGPGARTPQPLGSPSYDTDRDRAQIRSVSSVGISNRPTQNLEASPIISWVIVGGESGPLARPSHPDWFRSLRDQCLSFHVPYFLKQWGEWIPKLYLENPDAARGKPWGTLDIAGNFFPETTPWNGHQGEDSELKEYLMVRVGRWASGALLDGRSHEEMPHA